MTSCFFQPSWRISLQSEISCMAPSPVLNQRGSNWSKNKWVNICASSESYHFLFILFFQLNIISSWQTWVLWNFLCWPLILCVLIIYSIEVILNFLKRFTIWKSFSYLEAGWETWAELLSHAASQKSWFQLGLFWFIIRTAIIFWVPNIRQVIDR